MLGTSLGLTAPYRICRARRITNAALAVLRKYGSNAHLYLPGVGAINGITAGNYLDSSGTTAASVDQPVGLMLDAMGVLGPMIALPALSAFTYRGSWSYNALGYINASGVGDATAPGVVLTPGKSYRVTCTAVQSGVFNVVLGDTYTGFNVVSGPNNSALFVCGAGTSFMIQGGANDLQLRDFTIREIPGIHASQPTTAAKPILRRGLVNLLTYSNDLSVGTSWVLAATGAGSSKITPDTSSAIHRVMHQATTVVSGSPYTFATRLSASGYRYVSINGAASANVGQATFDLQSGVVVSINNGTASILALGDGSYLCVVSATSAATVCSTFIQVNNVAGVIDTTFAGDGTSGITFGGAALFQGTVTAQQILDAGGIPLTTTAPASSANGIYSAQFDGNDYLSLGSVPFQMTDSFALIVGHVNNDISGYPMAYGQQKVGSIHRFELFSALGKPAISLIGSINQYIVGPDMTNGQRLVQSCRKIGAIATGRVNGISIGQADVSGNTMQVHDVATIGANNGGLNNFCVGHIYPVIAIKGTVSDADLLTLEKFVGSLSGVTL